MEKTRHTYVNLFTHDDLSDELPFEFEYEGESINNSIPGKDEIVRAFRKMRNRKASGLSRISVDDLKRWYNDAHPEEDENREADSDEIERWQTIVKIIKDCLRGEIPKAFTLGVLFIFPKDDHGGVRGIGLLESIHKIVSRIINIRMANTFNFFKEVHGF